MKKANWVLVITFMVLGTTARADSLAGLTTTLDSFHQAAAQADMDSYFATMAEDVVFLGTDGSERWQGQVFRDFVQSHFSAGRGWTYHSVKRNVIVAADGRTAWFDETLQNDALGLCRGSGVLVKSGQGWKIAQYNLSVPVPNAMVHEVVADIAASNKATATDPVPDHATTTESAMSALAAGEAGVEEPVAETQGSTTASGDCRRKRFKTNRKAGC